MTRSASIKEKIDQIRASKIEMEGKIKALVMSFETANSVKVMRNNREPNKTEVWDLGLLIDIDVLRTHHKQSDREGVEL